MRNWKFVNLSTVTNNLDNKRIPLNSKQRSEKESNPIYPYIGANKIMTYVDEYIFDEKILCVAEDGGSWGHNETCAVIYNEKVWVNNHAHVLTAKESLILEYLKYFLNYTDLNLHINGATRGKLTKSALNSIQIPLPPLETQKKIAAILDAADVYRQKTKALIAKYDELTQSLFLDMFGDPVRNEKGWEKKIILELVNPDRPITYGILMPKENVKPAGIPYIKVVDVKNGEILDDQVCHTSEEIESKYKRSRLKKNDLLISIRGHVGRIYLVPKRYEEANITQDTARLAFNETIMPAYAEGCFNTIEFQRYMSRFVKGAGVKGINLGDLKKLEFPVPSIKKQELFEKEVLSIKNQKANAQKSLEKAEELFNSLLKRAFKGEM